MSSTLTEVKRDREYQIQRDAEALVEAEKVKADKQRLAAARKYLLQGLKATTAAVGKPK